MFKAIVSDTPYTIEFNKDGASGTLNGAPFTWDMLRLAPDRFHILRDHRSYNVIVEARNPETHEYTLRVNGKKITVQVKDKMDLLMEAMGLSNGVGKKVNEVKAPMPGLVIRTLAAEGDHVEKGDSLLVLEAMKMENVIKSPGSGEVARIHVNQGQAVEKNQVLVTFK